MPPERINFLPAIFPTVSGHTVSVASSGRLVSLDVFRGLTMAVMIFVNDLASVRGLPWWTYHMPGQVNGMTYVDVVFPAFLFLVGMAIPLALKSRLLKDPSEVRLWGHVFLRAMSLVVLGLILANAEEGNGMLMGIAPNWWAFTALVAAFLFWNSYPRHPKFQITARVLKLVGLAALVALFALFRRTTGDGHVAWIDFSYWEILGLIGWAYLSVCICYIPTRRLRYAPSCWFLALLALNVGSSAGWLNGLSGVPAYFWPFGSGASVLIVMGGVMTTQIFAQTGTTSTLAQKLTRASVFASGCLIAGWLLTPLGISKIRATPTWCLYSIALSVVLYGVIYWLCDIQGWTSWASFILPAGSNALTTYLIPDLIYFAVAGSALDATFNHGWPGVVRAAVFTLTMLALAAAFSKAKIRLQL